jgi:hypothetical protein
MSIFGAMPNNLENISMIAMLVCWPAELDVVASGTGIVSFLKMASCTASVLVLGVAAGGWVLAGVRHRIRGYAAPEDPKA